MFTPYQTQYFAWQLTRRLSSEDEDKLTGAIMDAQIGLNLHQGLQEKFGVEGHILESASFNKARKAGEQNPLDMGEGLFPQGEEGTESQKSIARLTINGADPDDRIDLLHSGFILGCKLNRNYGPAINGN